MLEKPQQNIVLNSCVLRGDSTSDFMKLHLNTISKCRGSLSSSQSPWMFLPPLVAIIVQQMFC